MSSTLLRRKAPPQNAPVDGTRMHHSTPDLTGKSGQKDRKTKQDIFYKCHACILGRTWLEKSEGFNDVKSNDLVKRLFNKRQSHNTLYCLEDRIRLEKSKLLGVGPVRSTIRYSSIRRLYTLPSNLGQATAFVVWIDDGLPAKGRMYLILKCKSIDDVDNIRQLVEQTQESPDRRLRDLPAIGQLGVGQSVSSIHSEPRSEDQHLEEVSDDDDDRYERSINGVAAQLVDECIRPIESVGRQQGVSYDLIEIDDPKLALTVSQDELMKDAYPHIAYDMLDKPDPVGKLTTMDHVGDDLEKDWSVNTTRFYWDADRGCVFDKNGPIFMFVAKKVC